MTVRAVEGKKPYTGGIGIEITEDKVINLRLRGENNLIEYDEGDNEIYVDLQLDDEITPTDELPVGITTGRIIVDNGWEFTGTIIVAKTTSGDLIKFVYADDGKFYIDNGTGTFKQIYLKSDIDTLINTLKVEIKAYVDEHDTVVSDTAPSDAYQGQLWYDTTTNKLKTYDGTQWNEIAGGATYSAGAGISIDQNNQISNSLPGPVVASSAPSNPVEGTLWYDTTNDVLKSYDGTNWNTVGGATYTAGNGININSSNQISVNKAQVLGDEVRLENSGFGVAELSVTNNSPRVQIGEMGSSGYSYVHLKPDNITYQYEDYIGGGADITETYNFTGGGTNQIARLGDMSVVSGDSGTTYTIKVSNTAPAAGTPNTTLTFVY